MLLLKLAAETAKEDQAEDAGPVIGFHAPGLLGAAGSFEGVDLHFEDLGSALERSVHAGARALDY